MALSNVGTVSSACLASGAGQTVQANGWAGGTTLQEAALPTSPALCPLTTLSAPWDLVQSSDSIVHSGTWGLFGTCSPLQGGTGLPAKREGPADPSYSSEASLGLSISSKPTLSPKQA